MKKADYPVRYVEEAEGNILKTHVYVRWGV